MANGTKNSKTKTKTTTKTKTKKRTKYQRPSSTKAGDIYNLMR